LQDEIACFSAVFSAGVSFAAPVAGAATAAPASPVATTHANTALAIRDMMKFLVGFLGAETMHLAPRVTSAAAFDPQGFAPLQRGIGARLTARNRRYRRDRASVSDGISPNCSR
jgi:hypothetical protein